MRRGILGLTAVAVVLLAALVIMPLLRAETPRGYAQESAVATPDASPAATEADVAALQTQVAVLQDEVVLLGGVDLPLISGRLGGSRASFDADYGQPVAYLDAEGNESAEPPVEGSPAQVRYAITDIGNLAVTFTDGRATAIVVTPAREAGRALTEADLADWTLEQANQVGGRFAPADAGPATLVSEQVAPAAGVELTVASTSAALATLFPVAAAADCGPAPAPGAFTASLTYSSAEQISALTYAVGGDAAAGTGNAGTLAPTTPAAPGEGRADRGGNANVTSSLGGSTTVNGIQVQATQIRPNAEGVLAAAPGQSLTAIGISITNTTNDTISYDLPDFVLVDPNGAEVAAICGGLDPAITRGELGSGETIEGWVTFQAPAEFVPERFVFLVNNARVGFTLQ